MPIGLFSFLLLDGHLLSHLDPGDFCVDVRARSLVEFQVQLLEFFHLLSVLGVELIDLSSHLNLGGHQILLRHRLEQLECTDALGTLDEVTERLLGVADTPLLP